MRLCFLLLFFHLIAHIDAQVVTRKIGFDPPHLISNGRGTGFTPGVREQGFYLSVPVNQAFSHMYVQPHLYPFSPINGSNYARFISGAENLSVKHEQGLRFTPVSVDISFSITSIMVLGMKDDGSTVSTTFTRAAGTQFQTCSFPSTFADIVELKIPSTGYNLDNLVVIPPVGETLTPPLSAPLVYDITWEDLPHQVGQVTSVGGQSSPSSVNFGVPYVRNGIGALTGRVLELSKGLSDSYDQIEMALGLNAERYTIDFDLCQLAGANVAFFIDLPNGFLRIDLGGGNISFLNYASGVLTGNPVSGPAYTASAATHFQAVWDEASRALTFLVNNVVKATWTLPAGNSIDIQGVRFSTDTSAVTGIDNVRIQASGKPSFHLVPGTFDFQATAVTGQRSVPVYVLNTGTSPVTITAGLVSNPAVALTGLSFPAVIPVGGRLEATVTTTPLLEDAQIADITFVSAAGNATTHIFAQGPPSTQTAYFSASPASRWVTLGSPLILTSTLVGTAVRYEWTRNNRVISGAGDSSLQVTTSATTSDAGVYQVRAILSNGNVVSSTPANIGIVNPINLSSSRSAGSSYLLVAQVAGPSQSYTWKLNGQPLPGSIPNLTLNGGAAQFTPLGIQHEGIYTCDVTMADGAGGSPLTTRALTMNLTIPQPPRITTTSLGYAMVGQPYLITLTRTSTSAVSGYFATGLPPGMTISASNGIIIGTPLPESIPIGSPPEQKLLYTVRVNAENQYGRGPTVELPLWVKPPLRSMRFAGLTGGGMTKGREGRWQATVGAAGNVTAQIDDGKVRWRALGLLRFDYLTGDLKGQLVSGSNLWDLRLRNERVLESIHSTGDAVFSFQAGICVDRLNPNQQPPGLYPTALMPSGTGSFSGYPFGASQVMARLGPGPMMNCVGVMADGSTFTASGELVHDWEDTTKVRFPFCVRTAQGLGLVQGWLITGGGLMDGRLVWIQDASPNYPSYPDGFSMDSLALYLQAIGSRHIPPGTGATLLNLHSKPQRLSAAYDFGISSSLNRLFSIDTRYRATPLPPADRQASLTINPADSSFSGSLALDSNFAGRPLMAKYRGLLVPRLGQGVGFLLAPNMELHAENIRNGRRSILVPFESMAVDLKPDVVK